MTWNPRALPSLDGKRYLVTGGSSGIGYFIVEQLAVAGAEVVLLARSEAKADAAIAQVRRVAPHAALSFVAFDLASLVSVARAAEAVTGAIDGLALNAGLVWPPKQRTLTREGLELVVGSNHVGHFALAAALFGKLAPGASVVSAGSMSTRTMRANFADLMQEHGAYDSNKVYPYSKHAVQAFGFEFDRRLAAAGSGIRSLVAHPGFALDVQSPRRGSVNAVSTLAWFGQTVLRPFTQGKDRGAWSMVRALVDPELNSGDYVGPAAGLKGQPRVAKPVAQDTDPTVGAALWRQSEEWAGVRFDV